jgi:hypothetical protein
MSALSRDVSGRATAAPSARGYQRKQAGKSALYRIMDKHYEAVLAQADEQAAGYPAFVRREFGRYLRCGRLAGGFSRLACRSCRFNRLLAFPCKGRLWPRCANRRMEHTAPFLSAKVLPKVAYRQWTVSLRWRIRWRVGANAKLISAALSVMLRSLFSWHRRAARRAGITKPLCGSVTFLHRFNSQLLLLAQVHARLPDGVLPLRSRLRLASRQVHSLRSRGRALRRRGWGTGFRAARAADRRRSRSAPTLHRRPSRGAGAAAKR